MSTNLGYQLLEAVARRIRAMGLHDIRDVTVQREPFGENQIRPGCYVTPPSEGNGDFEEYSKSTNERSGVGYGVQVTVVSGSVGGMLDSPSLQTDWRQAVRRRFHRRRLEATDRELNDTGFSDLGCTVHPGKFSKKDGDRRNENRFDISVQVVRCWVLERRNG